MSRKKPLRSTVPFDRDPKFVGRQDVLAALELQFYQSNSHNRAVLVGLGGSQNAIEYSYRLRVKDPQVWVFWVYASPAERFEQAYRPIAIELDLPGSDDPKTDVLGLLSRWLSDTRSEGSRMGNHTALPLSSYIPQTTTGSVLLSTRDRRAASWLSTGYTSIIPVNLMDSKDAEQLLCINIPDAITQAAAYISAKAIRMSGSKYLMLYRQDEQSQSRLLDEQSGDLRRDPGIKQNKPRAAELLSLMAMLDRQGIPEFLLPVRYPNALDLEDALAPLDEFSLITIEI
ncbi:hypothetical protein BJ875DRAFT_488840 [Amylocarpus encephaloides]|uniref:Uncharacterized protein n=1 Tax=Amylocarpus encephaloides TaxID=45428 RepID=A0A9P7Y9H6_9HELO|nr:hypothetical protein BJ875DRAFT_488840 [Amylocarpus encephaloides]